ncbi:hypothetical protein ACFYMI_23615 [Streptomyces collinus]|uniref:hypothetical protein n=1 Tax=Streptomyces collinus TaxID=42684 RepID=UPI0036BEB2D6
MEEFVTEEATLPSAPGEAEHPALALANSAVALHRPGGPGRSPAPDGPVRPWLR